MFNINLASYVLSQMLLTLPTYLLFQSISFIRTSLQIWVFKKLSLGFPTLVPCSLTAAAGNGFKQITESLLGLECHPQGRNGSCSTPSHFPAWKQHWGGGYFPFFCSLCTEYTTWISKNGKIIPPPSTVSTLKKNGLGGRQEPFLPLWWHAVPVWTLLDFKSHSPCYAAMGNLSWVQQTQN